jgi:hypothetical protein
VWPTAAFSAQDTRGFQSKLIKQTSQLTCPVKLPPNGQGGGGRNESNEYRTLNINQRTVKHFFIEIINAMENVMNKKAASLRVTDRLLFD